MSTLTAREEAKTRGPDVAKGYPLVGVLPHIWRDPLGYFVKLSRDSGELVEFRVGPQRLLFLNHPRHVKHVLQDNHQAYRKSDFYKVLRPLFGAGLLLAEGEPWLAQRRIALPAFQGPCLRALVGTMDRAIGDMLMRWDSQPNPDDPVEINREMTRLTLDVLLRTLFGTTAAGMSDDIYTELTTVLRHAERRVWSLVPVPEWLPTRENRAAAQALHKLEDIVWRMIEGQWSATPEEGDLLSRFLEAYAGDRRLLRDEVISMMMAGHETTANALTWTWLTLSQRPDVVERIRAEVAREGGRLDDLDAIGRLRFTRAVVEEVMRLNPPVWTISRTAICDDQFDGVAIRAGTTVTMCAYALHRNPRFWPDPDDFVPQRFLEEQATHMRYAYFPFGGGPRICLGMRFALTEAVLAVARVLESFSLELLPGQSAEPEPMITLRPRHRVMMMVRRRSAPLKMAV